MARAGVALAMIAIAAAACGGAGAGAGDPGPDPSTAAARFTLAVPVGASPAVQAVFATPAGERSLTASDPGGLAEFTADRPAWFPTPSSGTLRVRVTLWGDAGELGADSLALPLQNGSAWTVEALVYRPAPGIAPPPCFGCTAETRAPLRASAARGIAPGDSLFLRATRQPAPGRMPMPPS